MQTNKKTCKEFVCSHPGCSKEYSTKFALKRHAITHTKKRKFACRFCTKKFALEQYQKEHEYIHTNETPYINWGTKKVLIQRAKLCLHRMSHNTYQKKSYRVFSRKDTPKITKQMKQTVHQTSINSNYISDGGYGLNELSNYDDLPFEYKLFGFDYSSLISTLSSKYCMCDIIDGYVDYSLLYSNLLSISSLITETSHMQQVRSNLSSLKIPKPCHSKSKDELLTPSTFESSPTVCNPAKENLSSCLEDIENQAQNLRSLKAAF